MTEHIKISNLDERLGWITRPNTPYLLLSKGRGQQHKFFINYIRSILIPFRRYILYFIPSFRVHFIGTATHKISYRTVTAAFSFFIIKRGPILRFTFQS